MTFMPKGRPGSRDRGGKSKISSGAIIEYEQHGSPVLAVINIPSKKKWLVIDENSKEIPLAVERIYLLPATLPAGDWPNAKKVTFLKQLSKKADLKVSSLNMEDIWKKCIEEKDPKAKSISDHTRTIFKSDQVVQHLALRRALLKDEVFFTRKGQNFEARKEQDVQRRLEQVKAKAEAEQKKISLVKAIKEQLSNNEAELPDEISSEVSELEDLALWGVKHPSAKGARDILNLCKESSVELKGKPADQAMDLLEKLGHFKEKENLSVIRHRIKRNFSDSVLEETAKVLELEHVEGRTDIRELFTISIDGEGTLDIDDALSIDSTGKEIGIHISDVAASVKPNSILDKVAETRASSIYCADEHIHMFPEELSKGGFSLLENQPRPALSYFVQLDEQGKVQSLRLERTLIQLNANLSYDTANHLLCDESTPSELNEQKEALLKLWDWAAKREACRIEAGATHLDRRDLSPKLNEKKEVRLEPISDDSPAFKLVGEMMILANECSASFAKKNKFPVVYRSQPAPGQDIHSAGESIIEGPAREYFIRGLLKRSETTTSPNPHFGLGLEQYAQTTSPIRRAADLINQQQIVSFIANGTACFSAEQIVEKLKAFEAPLEKTGLVQMERNRYWLLSYIVDNNLTELEATIVKVAGTKPLAELKISQTTAPFKTENKEEKIKSRLGQKVTLIIETINPKRGTLRLVEKIEKPS